MSGNTGHGSTGSGGAAIDSSALENLKTLTPGEDIPHTSATGGQAETELS